MAQTQTRSFIVEPVFSLKDFEQFLSNEISPTYRSEINKILQAKSKGFTPEEVAIEQLPMKFRSMAYIYTPIRRQNELNLEQVYLECVRMRIEPLSLPYLLGMVSKYPQVLSQELESVQSIETLYWPDTFSFHSRFGKKKTQLCLKKQNGKLCFKISDFVAEDNIINPFRRIGPTGVRIIAKVINGQGETTFDNSRLEGKMIG